MSEALKEKGKILGGMISLTISAIFSLIVMVLLIPFMSFGQKENKLLESMKTTYSVPTAHASDQFGCACCCCTDGGGGGTGGGCCCGGCGTACGGGGGGGCSGCSGATGGGGGGK